MPGRRLFDRVVVVDWSAASTPKWGADSIWIATVDRRGRRVENLPTRRVAEDRLAGLLDDAEGDRTLLGVDFSLGYPAGTAAALGLDGTPWRAMWTVLDAEIDDDGGNRNNRFRVAADLNALVDGPGPFWGRPAGRRLPGLTPTKVHNAAVPEWRAVEVALRSQGWRPFSSWQLLGAGCVGSQSLVGIPIVERVRRRGGARVDVWPFTTGLEAPAPGWGGLVVAEVWPSLVDIAAAPHQVRDAAQVDALAEWLTELDRRGRLGAAFAPVVDQPTERAAVAEEGWILGVPATAPASPAALAASPATAAVGTG